MDLGQVLAASCPYSALQFQTTLQRRKVFTQVYSLEAWLPMGWSVPAPLPSTPVPWDHLHQLSPHVQCPFGPGHTPPPTPHHSHLNVNICRASESVLFTQTTEMCVLVSVPSQRFIPHLKLLKTALEAFPWNVLGGGELCSLMLGYFPQQLRVL